jgi:hypothetical protein
VSMTDLAVRTMVISAVVSAMVSSASAQSADELAKQTQNPVSSLISLPFQANWDVGIGSREATGTTLNIQPVAPFALTKQWNIILRVIMPLVSQPTDDGLRINGMSDSVATAFLSPARTGKVIWGVSARCCCCRRRPTMRSGATKLVWVRLSWPWCNQADGPPGFSGTRSGLSTALSIVTT